MSSEASRRLAKSLRPGLSDQFQEDVAVELDDYADHIASRVMAHLRGEAGLDVDQALKQFTGNLEQDMRSGWKHNINDTEPTHD
jgi:hypothetical protein